jgi:hypothetical protein
MRDITDPAEARAVLFAEAQRRIRRGMNEVAAAQLAESRFPDLADLAGQHTDPSTPTKQDREDAARFGLDPATLVARRAAYERTPMPPTTAHRQLVDLAEERRRLNPKLTPEMAYAEVAMERPALLAAANSPEERRIQMAELRHANDHADEIALAFAESPAGKAHAQLEAFAEQIRQRPGGYMVSPEIAYAQAAKAHPEVFAEALNFMAGQQPQPRVPQHREPASAAARFPVSDLDSAHDVLSTPRTWPKSAMPKAGEVENLDEWMKLARKAARPNESVEDAFRRIRRSAGVKE